MADIQEIVEALATQLRTQITDPTLTIVTSQASGRSSSRGGSIPLTMSAIPRPVRSWLPRQENYLL